MKKQSVLFLFVAMSCNAPAQTSTTTTVYTEDGMAVTIPGAPVAVSPVVGRGRADLGCLVASVRVQEEPRPRRIRSFATTFVFHAFCALCIFFLFLSG